jgi:hypothetical protein
MRLTSGTAIFLVWRPSFGVCPGTWTESLP